jgi:hypothetical protein
MPYAFGEIKCGTIIVVKMLIITATTRRARSASGPDRARLSISSTSTMESYADEGALSRG